MFSRDERLLATGSPAALASVTSRDRWVPYDHLLELNDALLRVAAGEVLRLAVTMPPRHGKSELISRYLPAWYLGRFPDRQVMLASYEASFAASWGAKARDLLEGFGPSLFGVAVSDASAAKDEWRIAGRDGVMVTSGLKGGITGKGAHLLIIDDPVKDAESAQSKTKRDAAWDWWVSTARPRLMPSTRTAPAGAVIVVMTRWHEDDLVGRLLEHQEDGDQWEVLNLPALAEDDDALGRPAGAALCPELFDERDLDSTRRAIGSYWWASLYQQRPAPAEGLLFKDEHFRYWTPSQTPDGETLIMLHKLDGEAHPIPVHKLTKFQTADIAASSKTTADYTVVSTFGRTPDGEIVVLDVARRRFDLLDVPGFIDGEHEKHGRPPLWVEDFGHGFGVVQALRRRGIAVHGAKPIGDKVTRAMDAVARYEAHDVFHPRTAAWLGDFEAEMKAFPSGANDDQVDTVAYAAIVLPKVTAVQAKPASTSARPEGTGAPVSAPVDATERRAARARRRRRGLADAEKIAQEMREEG
jgi:predicted phage terminase large subunit-like protein